MKKLFPLIILLLMSAVFVSSVSPLKPPVFKIVYVPDPLIQVIFLDDPTPLNITDYVLVKGTDIVAAELAQASNESNETITFISVPLSSPLRSDSIPWIFNFTPEQTLEEAEYTFRIVAEDVFGNSAVFYDFFKIEKLPFGVELIEPSYGVSDSSKFDVVVSTTFDSECHFNMFDDGFDNSLPFQTTGGTTHSTTHKLKSINTVYPFFVYCMNDRGELASAVFNLSADPTEPVLISLDVTNAWSGVIVERVIIEPNRRADLVAITDDPTQCFYSVNDGVSKLVSEEFTTDHSFSESFLDDFTTHTFEVECFNKAELKSNKKSVSVLVDTSQPIGFDIVSPIKFVSSLTVDFLIKTSKSSECSLVDMDGKVVNLTEGPEHKTHITTKTFLEDGLKKFNLVCDFLRTFPDGTAGSDSIKKEFKFVIDSSKPIISNVTTEPITSSLTKLSAVIIADDPESGIMAYYYTIREVLGEELISWNLSSDRDVTVKGLNLTNGSRYVFDAIVTNGAGLNSSKVSSKEILVDISYTGIENVVAVANATTLPPTEPDVLRPEDEVDDLAERLPSAEQPFIEPEEGSKLLSFLLIGLAVVLLGAGGFVAWQYTQSKKVVPGKPAIRPGAKPLMRRPTPGIAPTIRPTIRKPTPAERAKVGKAKRKATERSSFFDTFAAKKKPEVAKPVEHAYVRKKPVEKPAKPVVKKAVPEFEKLSAIKKKDDVFSKMASLSPKKVDNIFDHLSKIENKDFDKLASVYKQKGEEKAMDALDNLSAKKKRDALDALNDIIKGGKK